MSLGAKYYCLLLRLLPREFREAHGADMLAAFEQMRQEHRSGADPLALGRFYLGLTLDVVRRVGPERERLRRHRQGRADARRGSPGMPLAGGTGTGLETWLADVRYTLRRMARSPGFTAIALLSLAVGIGANAATFALVEPLLFLDLPYGAPEEMVEVYLDIGAFPSGALSYPDYVDVREGSGGVFVDMGTGAYTFGQRVRGDQVQSLLGEMVSGSYFPTLRMGAALGRTILPEDHISPGAHWVVMLGYGYWQREYGEDPDVLGETLVINGQGYTIVGVAPADYPGIVRGVPVDFIVPVSMAAEIMPLQTDRVSDRGDQGFFTKARLRPGVSLEQAKLTLAGIGADLEETYPDIWNGSIHFRLVPTADVIMNPVMDRLILPASVLALALVGIVLLITCSNLASFLLARGTDRRKEIAVRLALGASRGDLVRQLLAETTVLALAGGALGLGAAVWLLGFLTRLNLPMPGSVRLTLAMTGRAYLVGLVAAMATALVFGLVPALRSTRPDLVPALKDDGATEGRRRRFSPRNTLVAGQVAASFVLLVFAGLLVRSLQAREKVDPGFGNEPTGLLTVLVPFSQYDPEAGRAVLREYLDRAGRLPEVEAVGLTGNVHLNTTNFSGVGLEVEGVDPPQGQKAWQSDQTQADPGFFRAAGIPILRGRSFDDRDVPVGEAVAIVNQAFAERFWPGEDPVSKTVRTVPQGRQLRVVGVSRTTKVRSLGEGPRPFIYTAYSQDYSALVTVVIRARGDAEPALQAALRTLREMGPEIIVVESRTMERHLGVLLLPARAGALLATLVAVVALVLASMGLFGAVSYAAAQRSREAGIRIALGAAPGSVVAQVVREGMTMVVVGAGVGLLLALGGAQLFRALLFGVGALDPVTFVGVPVLLLGVALAAAWVPARRVSRLDPAKVLKAD